MVKPNRICQQCGTSLNPDEDFCNNCGRHYTGSAMIDLAQHASSPGQSPANPSLPQMEPAKFAWPAGGGFAWPPQFRKSPNIGLIIGIVLLLLVLIGSGFYFLNRGKSSSTNGTGTSTAITKVGTPQALFSDNFADNSKGWSAGTGSGYNSTIGNNEMSLSEANHKILDEAVPGSNNSPATFTDFSVTTTFTLIKADQNDSVGLYIRGDSNLSQGYFVDIFGDNTYDIVKVFPESSKDTFLISPTNSPAINAVGQQNKLTVVMKGASIVLLINGKVVESIIDSGYTSGQIALFAENGRTSSGVSAIFNSIAVYPAPGKLPG
jgi:hypothetical protein